MTILIFVVIDPDLQVTVKDMTIEKTTQIMQDFGVDSETLDKSIQDIREQDSYSVGAQLKGYFFSLIFASIFGLLFSLILKKKQED